MTDEEAKNILLPPGSEARRLYDENPGRDLSHHGFRNRMRAEAQAAAQPAEGEVENAAR